jgi:hypothetical protein
MKRSELNAAARDRHTGSATLWLFRKGQLAARAA